MLLKRKLGDWFAGASSSRSRVECAYYFPTPSSMTSFRQFEVGLSAMAGVFLPQKSAYATNQSFVF